MAQKAVKRAVLKAVVTKAASCHTFRYTYATHLLERGQAIHTIQVPDVNYLGGSRQLRRRVTPGPPPAMGGGGDSEK